MCDLSSWLAKGCGTSQLLKLPSGGEGLIQLDH